MVPLKATTLGAWYHSTVYELSLATPFSVQSLVHSCPDVQQQSSECLGELSPWTGLPIHCQTESKQRCALCVHGASKRLPKPLPIELAGATTTELPNASNSSLAPTAHRHQGREGSSERNEGCLHTSRSLGAPAISLPCGPQASIYLGARSPSSPLRSAGTRAVDGSGNRRWLSLGLSSPMDYAKPSGKTVGKDELTCAGQRSSPGWGPLGA